MVTRVRGNDEGFCPEGFGEASGEGKEDAIAEGDDRFLHITIFIVTFGDVATGLKEVGGEEGVDDGEVSGMKGDSGFVRLPLGHGKLFGIVFGAIMDSEAGKDFMAFREGIPEGHGRVHASGEENDGFHGEDLSMSFFVNRKIRMTFSFGALSSFVRQ